MKSKKPPLKEHLRALAAENPEEAEKRLRARTRPSSPMAKVIKKAASLCDMFDDADRETAARVIREAMEATRPFYNQATKRLEYREDTRMRLAASALLLAYVEGLPVQRTINAHVKVETVEDTLAKLRGSPMALEAVAGLGRAGLKMKIAGQLMEPAEVLARVANASKRGSSETPEAEGFR